MIRRLLCHVVLGSICLANIALAQTQGYRPTARMPYRDAANSGRSAIVRRPVQQAEYWQPERPQSPSLGAQNSVVKPSVPSRAPTTTTIEPGPEQEELPPYGAQYAEPAMDDGGVWNTWGGRFDNGTCCCGERYNCGYDECTFGTHPCGCHCNPSGVWARTEYLYWWVRGQNVPPLVTTSPEGTPRAQAGVLPDATILFGNQLTDRSPRSGGRFTLGWLNPCGTAGVEGNFFFLGDASTDYQAASNSSGVPTLARPFVRSDTNVQEALLVAYNDPQLGPFASGNVNIHTSNSVLGAEANYRRAIYNGCCSRLDALIGYRFFRVSDGVYINTNSTILNSQSGFPVGTTFAVNDSFMSQNYFNGGQIGMNYGRQLNNCWSVDLTAKIAIGGIWEKARINGTTARTLPTGSVADFTGGVLALPSNIGNYSRSRFGALPELGATFVRKLNHRWDLSFGYNVMWLSNVVRAGEQIDTKIDVAQLPPGQSGNFPQFTFHESTIWLQGMTLGLEGCF